MIERHRVDRWWENYFVRYFVGTVVGVIVILALREHAVLRSYFCEIIPSGERLSGAEVGIVAGLGLAFCYVASAPVLTLHAVRGALALHSKDVWAEFGWIFGGSLVFAFVTFVLFGMDDTWPGVVSWTFILWVSSFQLAALWVANIGDAKAVESFYGKLVVARRRDWEERGDYVDSYRHLREHGNAMSIVIFEIVLGAVLSRIATPAQFIAALIAWIAPAAMCWLFASILEARFADRKGEWPADLLE